MSRRIGKDMSELRERIKAETKDKEKKRVIRQEVHRSFVSFFLLLFLFLFLFLRLKEEERRRRKEEKRGGWMSCLPFTPLDAFLRHLISVVSRGHNMTEMCASNNNKEWRWWSTCVIRVTCSLYELSAKDWLHVFSGGVTANQFYYHLQI